MNQDICRRRGQPLAVLVLLVAGWALMRVLSWQSPLPSADTAAIGKAGSSAPSAAAQAGRRWPDLARGRDARGGVVVGGERSAPLAREPMWPQVPPAPPPRLLSPPAQSVIVEQPVAPTPLPLARPGLAGGHQLMFMAGLAQLPLPAALAATAQPIAPPAALPPRGLPQDRRPPTLATLLARSRWSSDGWLLWRRGSAGLAAAGQAAYGGSQVGAVLRYSLAPASGHAPAAYARISRALAFSEGEAALGFSARPVAGVPLRLLGEARVQRSGGRTRLRPAASLVSELPPQRLAGGFTAEAYAQAGYVGGAAGTPFFDGQVTAERRALAAGPVEVHLGGGAWAGGQEGAARLDIGPRASLRLGLGGSSSRLALDWRFRIAGDAAPASGPSLTLSAGF